MGVAVRPGTSGDPAARAARGVVARRALSDRLAGAGRVTVLSAPAGSGKTVLLRSWVREAGLAERAAWVAVPSGERDPQRFWTHLRHLCDKLGAHRRAEADQARALGLLAPSARKPWRAANHQDQVTPAHQAGTEA